MIEGEADALSGVRYPADLKLAYLPLRWYPDWGQVKERSAKLQIQRTSQPASKRLCLAGVALALFLSGGASPVAEEMPDNEGSLVGLLLKTWTLKEQIVADIQVCDREIQANERIFQEAEKRMSNATETFNDQAIHAAREPLRKAQAEKKRLKQARERLDLAMTRAEASYAAVRDLLVSGQDKGSNSLIRGLVSLQSGKAKVLRKDGKEVALDDTHPRFLRLGDEMVTMGGSRAEGQVFDGRPAVLLGERSRLKLEADAPQEQILQLSRGKIYCSVDEGEAFADRLRDSAKNLEADPQLQEAIAQTGEEIKGWIEKKFTVRTPSACCSARGTKFSVEFRNGKGTEVAVFEGAADVGDAECAKQVRVEQGFKVTMTKDGISVPQKVSDIDKWWEK